LVTRRSQAVLSHLSQARPQVPCCGSEERSRYTGYSISDINGEMRRNPDMTAKERDASLDRMRQDGYRLQRIQRYEELLHTLETLPSLN